MSLVHLQQVLSLTQIRILFLYFSVLPVVLPQPTKPEKLDKLLHEKNLQSHCVIIIELSEITRYFSSVSSFFMQ
ncbi:hypothetical protein SAMN02745220_02589 [Desulfopila aestuarii DSM 18488]|uniref:Uncharacterized protein n=1 Tax=Desulfopila aestuarii DSM 18488 TaxID=1121416 RepID=A0A1M7Y8Y4_9BACT|nr:hypothetical protein SAMN02745220_02589 [Desulfopila aestuarii DSM 18488]